MARTRSPNYPSVDLATAAESAKAFYNRESRTAVSPEVAVKAWGFNSLNGTSRSRLSALKQFGLVSTDRQGKVQLSDAGLTLAVASPSSQRYRDALRTAVLQPVIYRQLYESMEKASDEALRHELILVRKFSEDGANRLIESYRSSLETAGLDLTDSELTEDGREEHASEGEADNGRSPRQDPPSRDRPPADSNAQFRWPLYDGIVAEVSFTGGEFTADDIQLLTDYLEVALKSKQRKSRTSIEPQVAHLDDEDDDVPF